MHKYSFALLAVLLSVSPLLAQQKYPAGFFRWPVDLKPAIVANMGELRPNHWHMGLDVRTDQKVNQLVFAAADGYIAKVVIEPQGFGRAIFIHHPNGLTTVYGHLNDFNPALEKYVTDQQYLRHQWATTIELKPDQFPVSKGTFIAFSGSTGGSQGPHVHFEIRDTKTDKCLNPLLFGFPLSDNTAPSLVRLAVYDRSYSVYEQTPQLLPLKNTDSGYIIPKMPVLKTPLHRLSFALQMFDRMTGSNNEDGVYSATLSMDGQPIVGFAIDSIDYIETHGVNAQIDYRYRYDGGFFLQHLSCLPGNQGPVYHRYAGDGVLEINDTLLHAIHIEVSDCYHNQSELNFYVQLNDSLKKTNIHSLLHSHFSPNQENVLNKPGFRLSLPVKALYDTIPVLFTNTPAVVKTAVSAVYGFDEPDIPVNGSFLVTVVPNREIDPAWKDKIILERSFDNRRTVQPVQWQGEAMTANFSDFGKFQALIDTIAPVISGLSTTDTLDLTPAGRIVFYAHDNTAVRNFTAELDGSWLRFTNDKNIAYIYDFDERCSDGLHQLKVTVEDLVGNTTVRTCWFKKYPYTAPPAKKKVAKKKGSTGKKTVKRKK